MVKARVYFLEAYLAHLLRQRARAEERAVGDASRFCRFLLDRSQPQDLEEFVCQTSNLRYRRQVERSVRRFLQWLRQESISGSSH